MWILFGLLASMLWGLTYVLDEELFSHLSVPTVMAITTFFASIAMFLVAWMQGTLWHDLSTLGHSRTLLFLCIGGIVTFTLANLFIGLSIHDKNATFAALLEISYPLFTAFFALLLFGKQQLTVHAVIGALLIVSGIAVLTVGKR